MASASAVKAGLDDIASAIRAQRTAMKNAKATAVAASADLANLANVYSDVLATINAYPDNTSNVFELVAKAELAKLTSEFTVLKGQADIVVALDLNG